MKGAEVSPHEVTENAPTPVGLYGKMPAHGDFVCRGLDYGFVSPWDTWLQSCVLHATETLGDALSELWSAAPAWCFRLPAGACGPHAIAGVLVPSSDEVGRLFPLTLARQLAPDVAPPAQWYECLLGAAREAIALGNNVDDLLALARRCDSLDAAEVAPSSELGTPEAGWWLPGSLRWKLPELPSPALFPALLRGDSMDDDASRVPQRPQEQTGAGTRAYDRLEQTLRVFGGDDETHEAQGALQWRSQAATHVGTVRTRNEDAHLDRGDIGLWAVADGAGGHDDGDVASHAIVDALAELPPALSAAELLAQVRLRLSAVHASLQQRSADNDREIALSTVVVLMVRRQYCACLWAGDSRAYLLRDGTLLQLTHDHSVVQELVDAGVIAREEAEGHPRANVITRAVGCEGALDLEKATEQLRSGDVLLLCSDGLFKAVPEQRIAAGLGAGENASELIEAAVAAGARDNVTAVVVRAFS